MAREISRGTCIRSQCSEPAYFKRLCKLHFRQVEPDAHVRDYRWTWNIVESFEGVVRATSEEEALRLVRQGVVAGSRTVIGPKPINIELVETTEC